MFGELPKLLGRDFAMGYFLPVVVWLGLSYLIWHGFDGARPGLGADSGTHFTVARMASENPVLGASVFTFISWIGAVLLLALNRTLLRVKEGYGRWNPARLFFRFQKRRWERLLARITELKKARRDLQANPQAVCGFQLADLVRAQQKKGLDFPDEEQWLLPTAFGNTIRAFEIYPRTIYGFDAIPGWQRLLFVISKDHLALVDASKAQMDFWFNLWVLSFLLLLELVAHTILQWDWSRSWLALLVLAFMYLTSRGARAAAKEWGEMVKSVFDVYLPELRAKLQLEPVATRTEEREQWKGFSQTMIYRSVKTLPERRSTD